METQLLVKIIHMSLASLLIVVMLGRTASLFVGTQGQQPNPKGRKLWVGLQHFSLSFITLTGLVSLYLKDFVVQPWFYAKLVLFFVMVSSMIKAFKKDETIALVQRRAGMVISLLALAGLLGLVIIKPVFS
ncbi:SirB2 family protein [Acinetobacter sp. B51(2017)]|uniref:SirB2 family protein n=1 Tax=Acinetobacter sp. B51(2017) TaxID=2060938 RepID=UPI000F0741D5|nr:SirB2 family protein [Acinetobacter sp. B51(2017)]